MPFNELSEAISKYGILLHVGFFIFCLSLIALVNLGVYARILFLGRSRIADFLNAKYANDLASQHKITGFLFSFLVVALIAVMGGICAFVGGQLFSRFTWIAWSILALACIAALIIGICAKPEELEKIVGGPFKKWFPLTLISFRLRPSVVGMMLIWQNGSWIKAPYEMLWSFCRRLLQLLPITIAVTLLAALIR